MIDSGVCIYNRDRGREKQWTRKKLMFYKTKNIITRSSWSLKLLRMNKKEISRNQDLNFSLTRKT